MGIGGRISPVVEIELDERGRFVIPKNFRGNWGKKLAFHPNYCAGVIRPTRVSLEEAIKSVEILLTDMYHQLELQKGGRGKLVRCGECGSARWVSEKSNEEKK